MKIKKFEIIIIIAVLAISFAVVLMLNLGEASGAVADVYYNGELLKSIDLSKNKTHNFEADYPVTLEVSSGAIRFVDSVCPDHLCEGFGYIKNPYENAVCMPAKVIVIVNE